ncbi:MULTISPECIES: RDD family protein [unclassified Pseudoalteromonas]|uniref:RDD family protein n=1 Tax=unclassified Pseudoalteromonas TaxID=194690 RepID=UPI0009E22951|nr:MULTISPECIES: RDD family protein [unclassified Pseudoalteromonas]
MTSSNYEYSQNREYKNIITVELTSFTRRFAAIIIDSILLSLILAVFFAVFYGDSDWLANQNEWSFNGIVYNELLPLLLVVMFWVHKAATPGKMLLNAKVVDAKTGNNLSIGQSIIRYVGYIISAIPFGLGFIWALFDEKKRGWHDMLAGSMVIRNDG